MGVIVGVAGANGSDGLGGKGFKAELGVRKIAIKYAPIQSVTKSTTILNISHNSSLLAPFLGASS